MYTATSTPASHPCKFVRAAPSSRGRRAFAKRNYEGQPGDDRVFEPCIRLGRGGSCIRGQLERCEMCGLPRSKPGQRQDKAWTRFVTAGYSVTRHCEPGARGGVAGGRLHPGGQVDRGAILPAVAAAVDGIFVAGFAPCFVFIIPTTRSVQL